MNGACWPAPTRDAVATTCTVCAQTGLVGRDGISSSAMDRSTASNGQMRLGVPEEPFGSQGEGADGAGFRVCVCVCVRARACVGVCVCDICPWLWGLEQFCIEVARCARWLRARWFGKG